MGEYAKYNGNEIKIGTCECMFYLRYDDRTKVEPICGNINPAIEKGLRFRLPFPDEDEIELGNYKDHSRGIVLINYGLPDDYYGIVQLSHKSGILINLQCRHGNGLPYIDSKAINMFWNGRDVNSAELTSVKNTENRLVPIVSCRWCNHSWSSDWERVLLCIPNHEVELKRRLELYSKISI